MKIKTLEIADKKFLMTAEFHPIVNLSGKTVLRYEALARFFNNDDFPISAEQTTYLIEEFGIIGKVTDFIFDAVCQLLKMKDTITASFNLSHLLINDMDYLSSLHQRCVANNVQAERIEIEISDKMTYSQFISSLPFLRKAKEFGFMVSLDKFGSGNLHMANLRLFQFDTIKIDRSIVDGIATNSAKLSTLHSFIDSVIPAGTNVICEGVERSADLKLLNRYNHVGIQGYMFSRPLTFTQLQLLEGF